MLICVLVTDIVARLFDRVMGFWSEWTRFLPLVQRSGGVLLILLGIMVYTNYLYVLASWLFRRVYNKPNSREKQKAARVVVALFEYYLQHPEERAASDPDPLTETMDFVAGMTDRYALATYRRLFMPRGEIFA
jgi:hypothetical protein